MAFGRGLYTGFTGNETGLPTMQPSVFLSQQAGEYLGKRFKFQYEDFEVSNVK